MNASLLLGIDYAHYRDFYSKMSTFSEAMHKKHLIKDFIPLIHMYAPLSMGIQVGDRGVRNSKVEKFS